MLKGIDMLKQKKIKIGTVVVFAVLVIAIMAVISSRGQGNIAAIKAAPVAVEVTAVSSGTLTETVAVVGTVSAMNDVLVSSETSGRITRVLVKVGDFVKAGQTLVQVDDELKAIAVDQSKAQLIAVDASYKKAKSDNDRAESLHATGDISNTELEAYRLGLRSAEAQYKTAEVGLRYAQRQLDDARIKTPISGFIASKTVEVGEMVDPGKEIANVVDISKVKVKLSIPEEEINKLKLKQTAILKIDTQPDRQFEGVVYTIGRKAESEVGHTYPVEVVVENKNTDLLKVGMFVRVEIKTASVANALLISKESLVNEDTQPAVYVVQNNIARLRPVKTGIRSGSSLQIVDGVKEGELVISFGQKKLKDGSPVQFKR
ncbi:MAG: efflux RND transporter periplasmic adaptor subunit [Bacteroidota bacterium]